MFIRSKLTVWSRCSSRHPRGQCTAYRCLNIYAWVTSIEAAYRSAQQLSHPSRRQSRQRRYRQMYVMNHLCPAQVKRKQSAGRFQVNAWQKLQNFSRRVKNRNQSPFVVSPSFLLLICEYQSCTTPLRLRTLCVCYVKSTCPVRGHPAILFESRLFRECPRKRT